MQVLQSVVQWVLNLGSNVFVPFIMFIIGLAAGLKFKKSFVAALTLGVAFTGMTLVVNYMTSFIFYCFIYIIVNGNVDISTFYIL